mmetsp:Transcript_24448/g.39718  ORF Transcript_24448/g.39718 Transcript_24448/m.39718 type:complete len:271 (+) Transcript_24448:221-1033(+)
MALNVDLATRSFAILSLNNLPRTYGRKKKRKGRGVGSGLGKTAGRGHKGQKARKGNKGLRGRGFEGGQTPMWKRLPKVGFSNNQFKTELGEVNLSRLQRYIDGGKIDPTKIITMKHLSDCGLCTGIKDGVKLLARPTRAEYDKQNDPEFTPIKQPIHIEVTRASKKAIELVERANGLVVTKYHDRIALKLLLKPWSFDHRLPPPRHARPPPKQMAYYTNFENRGYLSPEIQLKLAGKADDVIGEWWDVEKVQKIAPGLPRTETESDNSTE